MAQAIETKELTLSYGDSIIIEEMDLLIPKGEITVFIGGTVAVNQRFFALLPDC